MAPVQLNKKRKVRVIMGWLMGSVGRDNLYDECRNISDTSCSRSHYSGSLRILWFILMNNTYTIIRLSTAIFPSHIEWECIYILDISVVCR